jgi:hypothetical protein
MIRLSTSYQLYEAEMLRGMLEQHGIACVIRNEQLVNTTGIRADFWPELWVLHDTDARKAMQLIEEWQSAGAGSNAADMWTCANCGKTSEGQFDSCWNCEVSRPR